LRRGKVGEGGQEEPSKLHYSARGGSSNAAPPEKMNLSGPGKTASLENEKAEVGAGIHRRSFEKEEILS